MKTLLAALATVTMLMAGCVTVTRVEPATPVAKANVGTGLWAFHVGTLIFSPDGRTLAVVPEYVFGHVQLWNVVDWTERAPLEESRTTGAPVCFSADGQRMAVGVRDASTGATGIGIFSVATSKRIAFLPMPDDVVPTDASFSRNGDTIVYVKSHVHHRFGGAYETTWVSESDLRSGETLWTDGPMDAYWSKLSPDGRMLAYVSVGSDNLELLDTISHQGRVTSKNLRGWALGGAFATSVFSPDDRRFGLVGSRSASIFDTHDGGVLEFTIQGRKGFHPAAAFSPTGRLLAISLPNAGVQILDLTNGKILSSVRESDLASFNPLSEVKAIAFSPDGGHLAMAGASGTVKLWEVSRVIGNSPIERIQ